MATSTAAQNVLYVLVLTNAVHQLAAQCPAERLAILRWISGELGSDVVLVNDNSQSASAGKSHPRYTAARAKLPGLVEAIRGKRWLTITLSEQETTDELSYGFSLAGINQELGGVSADKVTDLMAKVGEARVAAVESVIQNVVGKVPYTLNGRTDEKNDWTAQAKAVIAGDSNGKTFDPYIVYQILCQAFTMAVDKAVTARIQVCQKPIEKFSQFQKEQEKEKNELKGIKAVFCRIFKKSSKE